MQTLPEPPEGRRCEAATMRQPHRHFGCMNQCVRVIAPQTVEVRLVRQGDGVVVSILAIAETIEDEQKDGGNFHAGLAFYWLFRCQSIKISMVTDLGDILADFSASHDAGME